MKLLTLGTFDLLHHGHVNLLKRAAPYGSMYVGVNSDRFVQQYKGKPPVEPEEERLDKVRDLDFVDWACINDGPGDLLVRLVKPDLLVIGSDWHDRYLPQINMTAEELFDELGCGIVYLPRTKNISTTQLSSLPAPTSKRFTIER